MIRLRAKELIAPHLEAHFHYHQKLKYWTTVHDHDFYECFFIVEGSVIHIVNGARQLLGRGALVFIRPRDVHSYEKYEEHEVELLNINFQAKMVREALAYLGDGFRPERLVKDGQPLTVQLSSGETSGLLDKYGAIAAIPPSRTEDIRTAARMLLMFILSEHFCPADPKIEQTTAPKWLQELQLQMREKENTAAGLEALYRLSKVSPEHLSRTIRRHLGKTPTEWINDMRLEHAAYLLGHSNIEILTVAMEYGFNNLSHFYKRFKDRYGMSPGKYRSLHRKTAIP